MTGMRHVIDELLPTSEDDVAMSSAPKSERNESDGAPLYRRVKEALASQIHDGTLAPGAQLPSERLLCERFGVSRVTARRALTALVADGLVVSSPGRGWYVSDGPLSEPPNMLLSFTAMARARGFEPTAKVLRADVRPATLDEAETLQVAPGAEVLDLERIRLLDGVPVAVHRSLVPVSLCPAVTSTDFSTASLYEALARDGKVARIAECTMEALAAGSEFGPPLDLDPTDPVLVSRQVTLDVRGRPLELSTIAYRGDRYRFRTILTAETQSP
jgi:GntR family transcriptional regulator